MLATIHIYGNLPVDIEFNSLYEPISASVHTNMGVVYLDMTDAELYALCSKNQGAISEQLREQKATRSSYRSYIKENELKAGDAW